MSNFIYRRRLGSLKRKNAAKVFLLWITGVGPVALLARFLPSKYLYDETMVFLGLYSIMAYFMFLFDNIRIVGIVLSPFLVAAMITSFFVTSPNRWNWVLGIALLPAWLLMASGYLFIMFIMLQALYSRVPSLPALVYYCSFRRVIIRLPRFRTEDLFANSRLCENCRGLLRNFNLLLGS